jgi:DNA-binding NtrC family response regulator
LNQRVDDIMPLVNHFLPNRELSLSAEKELIEHVWQGNVRELENTCKRVAVLSPEGVIEAKDFAFSEKLNIGSTSIPASSSEDDSSARGMQGPQNLSLPNQTPAAEPTKDELETAMHQHQGVVARVARQFGLSRQALYRRLDKLGIAY